MLVVVVVVVMVVMVMLMTPQRQRQCDGMSLLVNMNKNTYDNASQTDGDYHNDDLLPQPKLIP